MVILIALVVFIASWAVAQLLRRPDVARTPVHPAQVYVETPSGATSSTGRQDGLTWTALDDLQLTRLLTESARRTNTE